MNRWHGGVRRRGTRRVAIWCFFLVAQVAQIWPMPFSWHLIVALPWLATSIVLLVLATGQRDREWLAIAAADDAAKAAAQ